MLFQAVKNAGYRYRLTDQQDRVRQEQLWAQHTFDLPPYWLILTTSNGTSTPSGIEIMTAFITRAPES